MEPEQGVRKKVPSALKSLQIYPIQIITVHK